MTDLLTDFWVHDVTVERLVGAGAFGNTYDTAAVLTGFVDDSRRLVRDVSGQEVISSARVFLPAATPDIPPGSRVTLPALFGGRTSQVITAAHHDAGGQPTPNHLELALQ